MYFPEFRSPPIAPLAAPAVLTGLGLATPTAFADIALTYSATDALGGSTSGSGTGNLAVSDATAGNFSVSITSSTTDPAGGSGTTTTPSYSSLSTTTFTISNAGSVTDTLDVVVTGSGFTIGASAPADVASFPFPGVRPFITRVSTTRSLRPPLTARRFQEPSLVVR